jgi:hypothetical protein
MMDQGMIRPIRRRRRWGLCDVGPDKISQVNGTMLEDLVKECLA